MYTDFQNQLFGKLAAINDSGIFNERGTIMSDMAVIEYEGEQLLNFRNPAPIQLNGCQTTLPASGTSVRTLEQRICQLLNTDDCILYNSPTDAGVALASHLLTRSDALIYGSLSQLSINGATSFCRATKYKYHSFDTSDIEKQLKLSQAQQNRLLIIDAVDIATGNIAPLNRIFELADKYCAIIAIDQTSSAGIIGYGGHGVCSLFDTNCTAEIHTGSLQNLGLSNGAYIAGRREIIDFLRQRTSNIQTSSPLTPANITTAETSISTICRMDKERQYILQITNYFIKKLYCLGLEIPPSMSSRFAVIVGDSNHTETIAETLAKKGVLVTALSTPYVSKDQGRLILNLSSNHTKEDVEKAANVFESIIKMFPKRQE